MLLTRDQILGADDLKREVVDVPEWMGEVLVRGLDGAERDAYEATIINQRGTDVKMNLANARAKLVQRSIIDESGALLFDESDVKRLAKKSAAALQRVYDVAARLSGLTKEDIDELTKNSENGQSGNSLSG